jgi:release factor glutamine methyltransferase
MPDAAILSEAICRATKRLRAAGVEEPRRDARLLLRIAAGLSAEEVLASPDRELATEAMRRFDAWIERRAAREPVSRIVGRREFWSLDFHVTPDTLDPRPDSETLVSAALDRLDGRSERRVLDLGTGTGCLLLAVLSERPGASGVGIDRSPAAARVAHDNARRLGLAGRAHFLAGDWASAIVGDFDVVLANPPYVAAPDVALLEPEVRDYEPGIALLAGDDGLDAYRAILPDVGRYLATGGSLIVEVGDRQIDSVAALMPRHGLRPAERRYDGAGVARCLVAEASGKPSPSSKIVVD